MKVKFNATLAGWKAGETHEVSAQEASWLLAKKLAEPVSEPSKSEAPKVDDLDALFAPEEKPKAKIKPATKAMKAPENKSEG